MYANALVIPVDELRRREFMFGAVLTLNLVGCMTLKDPDKQILKAARWYQRQTKDAETRRVLERICQYQTNRMLAVETVHQLMLTGDY